MPQAIEHGYPVTTRQLEIFAADAELNPLPEGEGAWTELLVLDGDTTVRNLGNLTPATTYNLRLRSFNEMGWSAWSPIGECTTKETPPPAPIDWTIPIIIGVASLIALCGLALGIYVWYKQHAFNATLFQGTKGSKKKMVDPAKKLEKFMDSQFTPGLDDAPDIEMNPVLVHKIQAAKDAEKKRKKNTPTGSGKSGGLARLKLNIVEKKQEGGGKSQAAKTVENWLSAQEGVDVTEQRYKKTTEAGKKGISALQAAQMGSAAGSSRTLMAQQQARAATRAAAGQGDDDPDDPKAGDGKGVKFSERL